MNILYDFNASQNLNVVRISAKAMENGKVVGICHMDSTKNAWTISSWYVDTDYQGRGIGTSLLQGSLQCLNEWIGEPSKIKYIWNGQNEYVMDWLNKHFSPISDCPIAVQKTQAEDDWASHMYTLNKDSVLEYFDIPVKEKEDLEYLDLDI